MWLSLSGLFSGFSATGDLSDRLNYIVTTLIVIVCSLLIGVRQNFFSPIQCAVPPTFTDSMEEFAEATCFQQTKIWPVFTDEFTAERREAKISYHQWLPVLLIVTAITFVLPWLLWRFVATHFGIQLKSLIDIASATRHLSTNGERKELLRLIAGRFGLPQRIQHRIGDDPKEADRRLQNPVLKIVFLVFGSLTTPLYLLLKLAFIYNLVKQMGHINTILVGPEADQTYVNNELTNVSNGIAYEAPGTNQMYVYNVFTNVSNDTAYEASALPKDVLCDYEIRVMGNVQRHTIQCLLISNMFAEKVFVFLWLWMSVVLILTVLSFLYWFLITAALPLNMWLVASLLRGVKRHWLALPLLWQFCYCFLAIDGITMLRMLPPDVAQELIEPLWDKYESDIRATGFDTEIKEETALVSAPQFARDEPVNVNAYAKAT